jgi:hypothetical protein
MGADANVPSGNGSGMLRSDGAGAELLRPPTLRTRRRILCFEPPEGRFDAGNGVGGPTGSQRCRRPLQLRRRLEGVIPAPLCPRPHAPQRRIGDGKGARGFSGLVQRLRQQHVALDQLRMKGARREPGRRDDATEGGSRSLRTAVP